MGAVQLNYPYSIVDPDELAVDLDDSKAGCPGSSLLRECAHRIAGF